MTVLLTGLLPGGAEGAVPHPLTVGLRTVELACDAEGRNPDAEALLEGAYCEEVARLLGERLGVPVERVNEAGPAPEQLPRVGVLWINTVVQLSLGTATAQAAWGSYAPQRGVPASEEGAPVTLPFEGSPETIATILAGEIVDQMPFVPSS